MKNLRKQSVCLASAILLVSAVSTTDTSAATNYKVKNQKLVYKKDGKTVKGTHVFKRVLYKNGVVAKGYTLYGKGQKATLYKNGRVAKGLVKYRSTYYVSGKIANETYKGITYKKGKILKQSAQSLNKAAQIAVDNYFNKTQQTKKDREVVMKKIQAMTDLGSKAELTKIMVDNQSIQLLIPDAEFNATIEDYTPGLKVDGAGAYVDESFEGPEFYLVWHFKYPTIGSFNRYIDERYIRTKDGWEEDKTYKTLRTAKGEYEMELRYLVAYDRIKAEVGYHFVYDLYLGYQAIVLPDGCTVDNVRNGVRFVTVSEAKLIEKALNSEPKVKTVANYKKAKAQVQKIAIQAEVKRGLNENVSGVYEGAPKDLFYSFR